MEATHTQQPSITVTVPSPTAATAPVATVEVKFSLYFSLLKSGHFFVGRRVFLVISLEI